jgi:hypothetical protein
MGYERGQRLGIKTLATNLWSAVSYQGRRIPGRRHQWEKLAW